MRDAEKSSEQEDNGVVGEHPALEPAEFAETVKKFFEDGVESMQSLTPKSYEVVVRVDDQIVPASELKVKLKKTDEFILEHKGVIIFASGLTVAGVLTAHRLLRTRKK